MSTIGNQNAPSAGAFYVQHGCVGNDALWWRAGRAGYTSNLNEAHVFSREEAFEIHANDRSHVPHAKAAHSQLPGAVPVGADQARLGFGGDRSLQFREGRLAVSYCRWSTDDYQCDVYCYQDVRGGYTTHVASNRPVLDGTLPPPVPFEIQNMQPWLDRHAAVAAWVDKAERRKIGLPHDGETFNDPDAASAADRLQALKDMGYNVPDHVIAVLREEGAEQSATSSGPLRAFVVSDREWFAARSAEEARAVYLAQTGCAVDEDVFRELTDAELDETFPVMDEDECPTGETGTMRQWLAAMSGPGFLAGIA